MVNQIKADPNSRRLIVTAWNPAEVDECKLPPCHCFFQFYVHNGKLSIKLYQRSADMFLGVPFNIASYALLLHMVAEVTDTVADKLIWTGGDCHIYSNHIEQMQQQIQRVPYKLPTLAINDLSDIDTYTLKDFNLKGYKNHPAIKGDVAV